MLPFQPSIVLFFVDVLLSDCYCYCVDSVVDCSAVKSVESCLMACESGYLILVAVWCYLILAVDGRKKSNKRTKK